jgi:TolA-binding protein
MSNRVEDLERQVAELQAAVNGLTEELVEMKERVRQVESEQEVEVETSARRTTGATPTDEASDDVSDDASDDVSDDATSGKRRTHSDDHVEVVEQAGSGADADDVIVPEQEATTPDAEAADDETTDDNESDDSDIIVA